MRSIGIHFNFKYDAAVLNTSIYDVCDDIICPCLNIPLVRVLDIIPVVLLAVENVPNLPGELGALPLVDQPQVSIGMTRPGTRLRLSITLEEVSDTLGVTVLNNTPLHWSPGGLSHLCLGLPLHDYDLPR